VHQPVGVRTQQEPPGRVVGLGDVDHRGNHLRLVPGHVLQRRLATRDGPPSAARRRTRCGPQPRTPDFSLVRHRDSANSSVAGLVDVVRELRDGGAFLPPELER
jgi:hypothetical protein